MGTYSFAIFALDDATTNIGGILTSQADGAQWDNNQWSQPTLTISSMATAQTVEINDTDPGDAGGTLDDDSTGQTLTSDLTINGVTYAAGSELQDEYEVTLVDEATGFEYRLVAISVREYGDFGTYTDTIIGFTFEGPSPEPGATLSYPGDDSAGWWQPDPTNQASDHQSLVPCFSPGSLVQTPNGPRPIETLKPGDFVTTVDHGDMQIRWVGKKFVSAQHLAASPNLRPIQISKGSLAPNLPNRDMVVSPQHRVIVRSKIAQRISGDTEVLVAAKHLCTLEGVEQISPEQGIQYIHLLFDTHEIIRVDGLETESLYPGKQTLRALSQPALAEIFALFPELKNEAHFTATARRLLSGKEGRALAYRHFKNCKPLIDLNQAA